VPSLAPAKFCAKCGGAIVAGAKYCSACGSSVGGPPTPAPAPMSSQALPLYTQSGNEIVADVQESQIYNHTFDEVFQACQEVIERQGRFIAEKDDAQGTISIKPAVGQPVGRLDAHFVCQIRIETVSTVPETRVTIRVHTAAQKHFWYNPLEINKFGHQTANETLVYLQKVLATYR